MEPAPASDGDLARRIAAAAGAARAAEAELCARFIGRVTSYGLRHLRDRAAADDLAQRTMLIVLEKLRAGALREPDAVGSFVLGVARTVAREARRPARDVPWGGAAEETHETIAPREPALAGPLLACLEALGERERAIVLFTYYAEHGAAEIGAALGITENHVRVARHRALASLRDCLGLTEELGR